MRITVSRSKGSGLIRFFGSRESGGDLPLAALVSERELWQGVDRTF